MLIYIRKLFGRRRRLLKTILENQFFIIKQNVKIMSNQDVINAALGSLQSSLGTIATAETSEAQSLTNLSSDFAALNAKLAAAGGVSDDSLTQLNNLATQFAAAAQSRTANAQALAALATANAPSSSIPPTTSDKTYTATTGETIVVA